MAKVQEGKHCEGLLFTLLGALCEIMLLLIKVTLTIT